MFFNPAYANSTDDDVTSLHRRRASYHFENLKPKATSHPNLRPEVTQESRKKKKKNASSVTLTSIGEDVPSTSTATATYAPEVHKPESTGSDISGVDVPVEVVVLKPDDGPEVSSRDGAKFHSVS